MLAAVSRKDSVIHNSYKCQYLISSNNYIPFLNSRNITAKRKDIYRNITAKRTKDIYRNIKYTLCFTWLLIISNL